MSMPNECGVYPPDTIYELARRGRAYVAIEVAQCQDGLYRSGIDFMSSYMGHCSPITEAGPGYATPTEARDAEATKFLSHFPTAWPSDPESVHTELRELRTQIEAGLRQPTLF